MNFKPIVVFDTETTSTDPQACSIVQLAMIAIDPRNLSIIVGSEFNANIKPHPDTIDPSTLAWHANRVGKTTDEVLAMWDEYPDAKIIWPEFTRHMSKYHTRQDRQSIHTAPIPAGANITKFDIPIVNRYQEMYGDKTATGPRPLFSGRDKIDLLDWFFLWFENNGEVKSYAMDNIRDFLGMSKENAHDAYQDVKDCAEIIIRFMKLHRSVANKVSFKGSFKK